MIFQQNHRYQSKVQQEQPLRECKDFCVFEVVVPTLKPKVVIAM